MKWIRRNVMIFVLVLAGCTAPSLNLAPTAETIALRLLSTTSTTPLLHDLVAAYQQERPQFRFAFRITETNYASLMIALNNDIPGETRFGLTHYLPPASPLWAAPLGEDQIAIITHPDNPVSNLTLTQLQAIYEGRLVNWADVGGEQGIITVISREDGSGTRTVFQELALGNRRATLNARLAPSSTAVLQIVRQDQRAIAYVSFSLVDDSVHPIAIDGLLPTTEQESDYPLRTPVFIVGNSEPEATYRAFIAWIQSESGQSIVARHYRPLLN